MHTSSTSRLRLAAAVLVTLALATGCSGVDDPQSDETPQLAQGLNGHGQGARRTIVTLREESGDVDGRVEALLARHGGRKVHVYTSALQGYAVEGLPAGAFEALRRDPRVASVTEESFGELDGYQSSPGWGLDRIDDAKGLDNSFTFTFTGAGVHIYLLDTGIAQYHDEFKGRVGEGFGACLGCDPFEDADGHGSGTASIAAGATKGVARGAAIHPVKIANYKQLNETDALAGLDWVANHAMKPAVVNWSNYIPTAAIAAALGVLTQKGITVVKSGGNYQFDACLDPTNAVTDAIAVGAIANTDTPAWFTNFGPCIATHAPGVDVAAATNYTRSGATYEEDPLPSYMIGSGTSFAAPYVTGIAATLLQQNALLTPKTVKSSIVNASWKDKLTGLKTGTPNRVANSTALVAEVNKTDIDSSDFVQPTTFSWFTGTFSPESTYEWERSTNGGAYVKVGSTFTYSMNIQPGASYMMSLRRTETWRGNKFTKYVSVKVFNYGGHGL